MSVIVVCLVSVGATLALVVWNAVGWPRVRRVERAAAGTLSILIPARDEEQTITPCIEAALAQGDVVLEVIVYDDRSRDATAAVVEQQRTRDPRVRLLFGAEPLPGWYGKPHACARLAESADGEWLLFIDADARLGAGAATSLLAEAQRYQVTLLSGWPGLVMMSSAERVLMPLLNLVVFSLFPAPLSLTRREPALGLAHGACLLVHRDTYRALGGHALVKQEIFEDSRLAQRWRASGQRSLCLDAQHFVSVRMYGSLREIWRGFQKNFFPAFQHQLSFWLFLVWRVLTFQVPFVLALWRPDPLAFAAVTGVILIRVVLALRFHHPLWSVIFQPLAELVLLGIALSSWWRCATGRGVEWKGRRYRQRSSAAV